MKDFFKKKNVEHVQVMNTVDTVCFLVICSIWSRDMVIKYVLWFIKCTIYGTHNCDMVFIVWVAIMFTAFFPFAFHSFHDLVGDLCFVR